MQRYLILIRDATKEHLAAICFAVIIGILLWSPSIFAVKLLGIEYKGVPFLYQDNELHYLARIQEIIDGHKGVGSPILYEYKDTPTPLPPVGEYFYALPAQILGMPIISVVILSKFVFPAILFLLIYLLSFYVFRDEGITSPKLYGILVASLSILGFDFVNYQHTLSIILGSGTLYLSIWTRLVNPITGGLLLFSYLIFIWKLGKWDMGEFRKRDVIVAGVLLGLMTGYFFSFAIATVFTLLLLIVNLLQKNKEEVKGLLAVIFVGFLINIFSAFHFVTSFLHGGGSGFAYKNGLLDTNEPLINKVLILTALLWACFLYVRWRIIKKISTAEIFVSLLIITGFLVMNEQVITGKAIWPQHFVQYTTLICYLTISFILASVFNWRFTTFGKVIAVIGIIFCFAFGLKTVFSYSAVKNNFSYIQGYAPLLSWLKANASKDCVVFVKEDREKLTPFIPAFTSCNLYHSADIHIGVPDDRIKHNYFVSLRLRGITANEIDQYLAANLDEIHHEYFFRDWKDMFLHTDNPWLISISNRNEIFSWREGKAKELSREYKEFLQKDFYTEISRYRLDYLIVDRRDASTSPIDTFSFFKKINSLGSIDVYRFGK